VNMAMFDFISYASLATSKAMKVCSSYPHV
jgi:hypothetical protein